MTTEIGITPQEKEAMAIVAKATELVNIAKSMKITDNKSYEEMSKFKLHIKERREEAMAKPLENKKKANGVWKFLSDICNMIEKPYDEAEAVVDHSMADYRNMLAIKRQEEVRKAEAKAKKQAEDARAAEIAAAKAIGDKEAAKNLKAAPLPIAAVAPKTPEAPKIAGMPVRKVWDFTVDVNKLDRKYMIADMVTLGKLVRALGANHGISGVTAFQKEVQ